MPRPETIRFVDELTPQERESLTVGLLKRTRAESRTKAFAAAAWLESALRVAGERDLADRVAEIHKELSTREVK